MNSLESVIAPIGKAANQAVGALESLEALDPIAVKLAGAVTKAVPVGATRDALSGTWLGHALHPVLTDVVIGSYTSASLLDLLGGDDDGKATERLIEVGIAASVPTVASGLTDWAMTIFGERRARPVGLAHATANLTASTLYGASLAARRRGERGRGKLLAAAGATVLAVGGFLGGHLSLTRGVGVNQTAFDEGPGDWTALDAADPGDGKPTSAMAGDTPVLLVRHHGHLHALHDRCSHRGCPLSGGKIEGESVTCPCHGSRFSLGDGSIERGPATSPQPIFETRERDGRIEVRLGVT
jgi:nitrite reductase/ring-hydroxylating ferredoxin subunit